MTVNVNGYPNPHNLSINKTLEKTLIEAQQTGTLCLSSRSLREFPACSQFDLSDTVAADLSKNRLGTLPEEVCSWASLQKLDLYSNVIKFVTDSVISLRSLTFLNLSRNYLSVLPAALCQLTELQILLVSHNKLVSLPEEIGHMKSLMELDASCNQLTHLPPQIGHLRALKVLNLRRNLVVELPVELSYLGLVHLDVSGNRISTIPPELRLVTSLVTLSILDNPLTSPPAQLCTRGKVHVFKYLEMLAQREEKKKGIMAREAASDPVTSTSNSSSSLGLPRRATVASMIMNPSMSSSPLGTNRFRYMNGDRTDTASPPPPPPPPRTLDLRQSFVSGENGSYPSTPSTLSPGDPNAVVGSLEEEISRELFRMRHAPSSPHRTSSPKKVPPPLPTSPPPQLRVKRSNSVKTSPQMQMPQQIPQPQAPSNPPQIPRQEMETQHYDANRNPAPPPNMGNGSSVGVPIPGPGHIQTYSKPENEDEREYKEALRLQRMGPTRSNGFSPPETNGAPTGTQQPQQQQHPPKTAIYGYVNARASPVKAVLYDGDGPPSQPVVPGVPQTVYSQPATAVKSPTAAPTGIATAPASKLSSPQKKPQIISNQPSRLKTTSNQNLRGSNSSLASVASSTASSSMIPKSGVKKLGTTRPVGNASHYGPGSTQTLGRRPAGMYSGVKSASNLSHATSRIGVPQTAPNATPNLSKMRVVNSTSTLDRTKRTGLVAGSSNSSLNPTGTIKREWEKVKVEKDRLAEMKKSIEARLKITLPADLSKALVDGVVLCHLANHIRPRSVASIHVPSPAVPKLTLAKCRKNVENFLEACRRIGIPEDCVCTVGDILESKNTSKLADMLGALLRTTPAPRVKH